MSQEVLSLLTLSCCIDFESESVASPKLKHNPMHFRTLRRHLLTKGALTAMCRVTQIHIWKGLGQDSVEEMSCKIED